MTKKLLRYVLSKKQKKKENPNINIGLDLNDSNQFEILLKRKSISFHCEHRSMNIYDLRPLPPELWARTSKQSPNESVKQPTPNA